MVTHARYLDRGVGYTRWLEVQDRVVEDRDHELSTTALPA
jgi:hypothetical protein